MRNTLFFTLLVGLLPILITAQTVTPYVTDANGSARLEQRSTVNFGTTTANNGARITVSSTREQTMDAFGFMLTQGAARAIGTLSTTRREALLNELFGDGVNGNGLRLSGVRIAIGASDLSTELFTYNENDGDTEMLQFSLDGPDRNEVFPLLRRIREINPNIKILATPWTAPTWMKENTSSNPYIGGRLQTRYYAAYARYFIRYLEEMRNEGLEIWAMTVQNEPENGTNDPSMLMTSSEQIDFINNHLGPALDASSFNPLIIGFDHNCDNTSYPINVINNSPYVNGAAFHLYAGQPEAMDTVHRQTNGGNIYFTEQYTDVNGDFSGDFDWHMRNVVNGSINNFSKTVFEWNLAAFPDGSPRTPGGCQTCLGGVSITGSNSYRREVAYYIIGQVAKFVRPGARRLVRSIDGNDLHASAFENPGGQRVVLVYNADGNSQTVRVRDGNRAFDYNIGSRTAVTFVYTPGVGGSNGTTQTPFAGRINLPGTIEAENFDNGGQGVAYNDSDMSNNGGEYRTTNVDIEQASEGGFNVGYITGGEWLEYSVNVASAGNYDFVFRVSSPNANGRLNVAFNGSNRTGTVSVPNTGGWQDWRDVTVSDVSLNAGNQVVRINFTAGDFNLNKVTVTATSSSAFAGFYNILNRGTGKGLDVGDNSTANNANVQQWDIDNGGGDNQRWEFEDLNNGFFRIKVKHTGRCLSQFRNSRYNAVQQNCQNISRQQWELQPVGSTEFFRLVNRSSGRQLSVDENNSDNGANVLAATTASSWKQQWQFVQVEDANSLQANNDNTLHQAGARVQRVAVEQRQSTKTVDLFPNPTSDRIKVTLPEAHQYHAVRILDVRGKTMAVTKEVTNAIQLELSLATLPSGVYFVRFESPERQLTKRVIKQ